MTNIVTELKLEHAELRNVLELVRSHGIGSPAGREALHAARQLFVDHIRHEDERFYPGFREMTRGDAASGAIADKFAGEMGGIGQENTIFLR